jgi:hypothetical protein
MRKIILKENLTDKQLPADLDSVLKMVLLNCPEYQADHKPVKINGKWVLKKIFPGKGYIALNADYTYDKFDTPNPDTEVGKIRPRPESQSRWRPCDAAIATTSNELSDDMKSTVAEFKKTNNLKTVEEIGGIGAYNSEQYQRYDIADLDKSSKTPKGKFFLYKERGIGGKLLSGPEEFRSLMGDSWSLDPIAGAEEMTVGEAMNQVAMKTPQRLRLRKTVSTIKSLDPNDTTTIDNLPIWKKAANVNLESLDPELKTFLDTVESNGAEGNFQKKFCVKAIKKLNYYDKSKKSASIISAIPQPQIEAWKQFAYTCANIDRGYFLRFVNDDIDELRVSGGNLSLKPFYKSAKGNRTIRESLDYRLKTIVRENLLMLSESKKKSVITEKQIVKTKFRPIVESKLNKNVKIDRLINETFYLINNGVDKKVVTESFWDLAKGFLGYGGSGVISYIKEKIVDSIIDKFVPGGSKTWLGGTISKSLSDIPLGDFINGKAFECEYLTEAIAKGISEEAVDKFQDKVGASGGFFDVVRNSLIEVIDDTTFFSRLKDGISTIICPTVSGLKDGLGKMVTSMSN